MFKLSGNKDSKAFQVTPRFLRLVDDYLTKNAAFFTANVARATMWNKAFLLVRLSCVSGSDTI